MVGRIADVIRSKDKAIVLPDPLKPLAVLSRQVLGRVRAKTAWILRIHTPIHMDSLCRVLDIWSLGRDTVAPEIL